MTKWGLTILSFSYFTMLLTEMWLYSRLRPGEYNFVDAFGSFSVNIMSSVGDLVVRLVLPLAIYIFLYTEWRLLDPGFAIWTFFVAFIIHETAYYLGHLAGHRIGFFWAFHHPHHSSEELNLSTATRGFLFGDPLANFLGLTGALLGIHPIVYFMVAIGKNIWGIFNHTQLIDKMGWMDQVLATPSNHRVHHGRNPQYIDKNYGQVLVLWDRLFGTFEPEVEPPDYGLVEPQYTTNPLKIWTSGWVWLARRVKSADRWSDKMRYLYKPPEWSHIKIVQPAQNEPATNYTPAK